MKNNYVNALKVIFLNLLLAVAITKGFGQDCSTCPVGVTCVGNPPPQTFFNTGSNAAGTGTLPIYSNDLNWTVSEGNIAGPYNPAKIITPNAAYYSSPFVNATWIAHNNDGSHSGNKDYYYKIEFNLPCMNNCGVDFSSDGNYCVTLDYFADNSVTAAYVNGVEKTLAGAAIANPYTYEGFKLAGRRTGTLCSGWQPGLNTLIIKVSSGQPFQGFLAQMSTSVVNPPSASVNPNVNLTQICAGQAATFNANPQNGGFSPSFQWQVNGTNVPGATSGTFTSSSLQNGDVVKVIMTPTPGCGSATQAQMTVNVLPVVNTNISISPANPEICAGNSINFTTTATYGSGVTPSYTWFKNGANVGTGNSYNASGLLDGDVIVVRMVSSYPCEVVNTVYDTVIVKVNPNPSVSVSASNITNACSVGGSDGAALATGTSGTGSYTYSINGGTFQSSNSFTGLVVGNYTVTIRDTKGCTGQTSFSITQPTANLSASVTSANIVNNCNVGGAAGSAIVSTNGGYGNYVYSLNGGTAQSSNSFTNLASGSYTVTVTDVNNCTTSAMFTIQDPNGELSANVNATNIVNNCTVGGATGSVQVTASGGFGSYLYSLNGGTAQSSNSFTGLSAGSYTVIVTDANNCSETVNFSIQEPAIALTASVAPSNITNNCTAGVANGSAQVTATGGYGSLTYSLNGGAPQSSNAFTGLAGGNYTVVVRDANGCTATTTFVITDANQSLTASIVQGNMIHNCNIGASTGSVQITTNGGFAPYSYVLNGGTVQSSNAYIGLAAGNYTVVITDANACSTQLNFTIQDPAQNLSASVAASNITQNCVAGASNGSALISVVGGFSPFTYALNGGTPQASNLFAGLASGSYTVIVRDSNGCATQTTFAIQDPAQSLSVSVASQNITHACATTSNGSAQVTASGGFAPYSYVINGATSQTSNMFANLGAGTYNVVVTDDNGCTATTSFNILTPAQNLTVSVSLDSIVNNCQIGVATGTAHITAAGGFGPISYSINGGTQQTSNVFQNLPAGNYTVSVRDTNGCTAQTTFSILDPLNGAIDIQGSVTHVSCNGDSNGAIDAQVTGGFAPYVFSWNHNAALNQEDATNLAPGSYTLSVIDDNGCTNQMTWTITEPAILTSTISQVVDVLCFGDATGAITVSPTGGTVPYSYTWNSNPPQTNATANQLEAGMYGVAIIDANGCITNNTATVQQPTLLTVTAYANVNAACYGTAIELFSQASGGTPDYQYTWTNGVTSNNQTIVVTQSESYSVTVTDANGCTANVAFPVNITLYPTPTANFTFNPQIITEKNPEVHFVNQSQNASYYLWNFGNGQSSGEENPIHLYAPEENDYIVQLVASNVHGCKDSASAMLTVVPDFALYIPNAFTPNGDKLNPKFLLVGKGYSSCKMSIFDRWGMELLQLEDDQPFVMGWDGTYKDKECPMGVYVYKLEIFDMRNQRYTYTGHINLLR